MLQLLETTLTLQDILHPVLLNNSLYAEIPVIIECYDRNFLMVYFLAMKLKKKLSMELQSQLNN